MGKRSRKRTGSSGSVTTPDEPSATGSTRAERDAARAARASKRAPKPARATASNTRAASPARRRRSPRGERPPAPWGNFPLVEICVLIALVLLIGGFIIGGTRGATMVLAGLAVGSLAGLELAIREHFAGYRSHTTVLSGAIALGTATVVALIAGKILLPILFAIAIVVFVAAFYLFRKVFRRRSGGLSFR
jgi:hypothetical protein